jgi:hypothetical protein
MNPLAGLEAVKTRMFHSLSSASAINVDDQYRKVIFAFMRQGLCITI